MVVTVRVEDSVYSWHMPELQEVRRFVESSARDVKHRIRHCILIKNNKHFTLHNQLQPNEYKYTRYLYLAISNH